MNNDPLSAVIALSKLGGSLIVGLRTSVEVMEKWNEFTPQKREDIIRTIKKLIEHGEKVFSHEQINF